jgi:hypothetical protein
LARNTFGVNDMRRYTLAAMLGLVVTSTAHALQSVQVGGWNNNRASTVSESRARGLSDVIRSRGQYEMDSADARISRTEARSRELDNRMKSTETYFERRNYNREQRFGTSEEKYAKKVANQERYARYVRRANPNELSKRQLDPLTGKITWSKTLLQDDYKDGRQKLDKLFAIRARQNGKISGETYEEISDASDELLAVLRKNSKELKADDYVAAKRFINALVHTAETS